MLSITLLGSVENKEIIINPLLNTVTDCPVTLVYNGKSFVMFMVNENCDLVYVNPQIVEHVENKILQNSPILRFIVKADVLWKKVERGVRGILK